MGDIDIDSYGCVAIAPLWLGGSSRQNSLSVIHSCNGIDGSKQVRTRPTAEWSRADLHIPRPDGVTPHPNLATPTAQWRHASPEFSHAHSRMALRLTQI